MIGVIADDLSGAAELGAIGRRFGLRALVVCGAASTSGWHLDPGRCVPTRAGDPNELVCVDTDSRLCSQSEARRRAKSAALALRGAPAKWIYKKVDSVLRGHVVAEVESIMAELGSSRAIIVAANPSRGRIVRRGQYWVGDRLIHETEFARDPEHPRCSSAILDMVGVGASDGVCVRRARADLPRKGIILGEAANARHLRDWAGHSRRKLLLGGAADFFQAILREKGLRETAAVPISSGIRSGRELFVCGTTSESASAFVRRSRAAHVPVLSLPSELAWGSEFTGPAVEAVARRAVSAFRRRNRVVLTIGLPPVRNPAIARLLVSHLVNVAATVLECGGVDRVYAEGGATAAALVSRMGWTQLVVTEEIAPGVATLCIGSDAGVQLTLKPGSYAWPAVVEGWNG